MGTHGFTDVVIEANRKGRLDRWMIAMVVQAFDLGIITEDVDDLACNDDGAGVTARDMLLRAWGVEVQPCPIADVVEYDNFTPEQHALFDAWSDAEDEKVRRVLREAAGLSLEAA